MSLQGPKVFLNHPVHMSRIAPRLGSATRKSEIVSLICAVGLSCNERKRERSRQKRIVREGDRPLERERDRRAASPTQADEPQAREKTESRRGCDTFLFPCLYFLSFRFRYTKSNVDSSRFVERCDARSIIFTFLTNLYIWINVKKIIRYTHTCIQLFINVCTIICI